MKIYDQLVLLGLGLFSEERVSGSASLRLDVSLWFLAGCSARHRFIRPIVDGIRSHYSFRWVCLTATDALIPNSSGIFSYA